MGLQVLLEQGPLFLCSQSCRLQSEVQLWAVGFPKAFLFGLQTVPFLCPHVVVLWMSVSCSALLMQTPVVLE